MSKNQSIKSFFTSAQNKKSSDKNQAKEATPSKIERDKESEEIEEIQLENDDDDLKSKKITKKAEKTATASSSTKTPKTPKQEAQKRQRKSSDSSPPKSTKKSEPASSKNLSAKKPSKTTAKSNKIEQDDDVIEDKENNKNSDNSKSKWDKSPELIVTKTSSEDEDSPVKRKPASGSNSTSKESNSKRRRVQVKSDSSSNEESSSSSKKEKPQTKPKAKEKSRSPPPKVKEKSKSPSPESSKTKTSKKKSDEKKDVKEMKKSPSPVKKEETHDEDDVKDVKKSPKNVKPEKEISNFFSKSTSNFTAGKKTDNKSSSKGSSAPSGLNDYLPNKENYHPLDDATWSKGQPVPYKALAQTFYCMEQTTKRLELLLIITNYFRSVLALNPKDLVPSIYILTNKVAPDYDSLELGIGDTVLFKALAEATGCTVAKLKVEFQNKGDIGLVAEANRCTQKLIFTPKKLTVNAVFTKFKEIASISGNSSQSKKCDLIKSLLVSCDAIEARYLMRSLAGKLRNGLGELSILQALGHACAITPPPLKETDDLIIDKFAKLRLKDPDEMKAKLEEAVGHVKKAYYQCPNYEKVIDAITTWGLDKLEEHCKLTPGVPLKPMLAYPTKGLQEVLKRFDAIEFTCEYKYDGERAQIHVLEDGSIKIYSRNSENNTTKYPDIIEFLQEFLELKSKNRKVEDDEKKTKVVSAILDAEVVAYDIENKIIKPFQILTTRKRKDVNTADIKIQVCIFAFDLLYLNGESLINSAFRKRRELLYEHFPSVESKLMYAVNMNSNNLESIQEFLDNSIKDGCEGLMVKTLDVEAHYEISKRSHNWLKLKKDYLEGVGDTLDLVVIGGYMGTGKRTGVYGGYLLACYDVENEEYQTICKLGTGLKDEDLQKQFESLSKIKIDEPRSYYRVNDTLEQPDHWFEPEQVWEIKCADFSISPVHTGALGLIEPGKGISMRFPRFIRLRDDKKCEEATSSEQLAEMYKNQQQLINQNQNQKGDNEDEEDME